MESLIEIAKCLTSAENKSNLIPIIIQLTGDKSWKVKLYLARNFAKLAEALGKEIADNSLFSIFSTLLRDMENEVRLEAMKSLKDFVKLLNSEKILGILAYLQTLAKDSVPLVRVMVCEVLKEIFNFQEDFKPDVIKSRVQPIIVDLSNDENLEVKIEALSLLAPWSKYAP